MCIILRIFTVSRPIGKRSVGRPLGMMQWRRRKWYHVTATYFISWNSLSTPRRYDEARKSVVRYQGSRWRHHKGPTHVFVLFFSSFSYFSPHVTSHLIEHRFWSMFYPVFLWTTMKLTVYSVHGRQTPRTPMHACLYYLLYCYIL